MVRVALGRSGGMNVEVFMYPNFEELPGDGGSFGGGYFVRSDYPDKGEELNAWIHNLRELSGIDTSVCSFHVVSGKKVIAGGTIKDRKTIGWR